MKNLIFIILLMPSLSFCQDYETKGSAIITINAGYNSGFVADIGVGFGLFGFKISEYNSDLDFGKAIPNLLPLRGLFLSAGYKTAFFDKLYHGPKANISLYIYIVQLELNAVYLFNKGNKEFMLEPAIGISLFGLGSLKFTYNISKITNFYPENYSKWGASIGINIPSGFF